MRKSKLRVNDCLCGFAAAWEMLIDIPFPETLRRFRGARRASGAETAAGFVLVGLLAGIVLAVAGGILNASWINRYAASAIFAFAAVAVCDGRDSFRGLKLLVSAVSGVFDGRGVRDSLLEASVSDGSFDRTAGCISALGILLLELFSFGLLAAGRASLWSVAVLVGGCIAQMVFSTLPRSGSEPPYLVIAPAARRRIWILPGVTALWMFLCFPVPTVAAAAVVGGLGVMIRRDFILTGTPVTADVITLAGKIAELALLLCGIVFVL